MTIIGEVYPAGSLSFVLAWRKEEKIMTKRKVVKKPAATRTVLVSHRDACPPSVTEIWVTFKTED